MPETRRVSIDMPKAQVFKMAMDTIKFAILNIVEQPVPAENMILTALALVYDKGGYDSGIKMEKFILALDHDKKMGAIKDEIKSELKLIDTQTLSNREIN